MWHTTNRPPCLQIDCGQLGGGIQQQQLSQLIDGFSVQSTDNTQLAFDDLHAAKGLIAQLKLQGEDIDHHAIAPRMHKGGGESRYHTFSFKAVRWLDAVVECGIEHQRFNGCIYSNLFNRYTFYVFDTIIDVLRVFLLIFAV